MRHEADMSNLFSKQIEQSCRERAYCMRTKTLTRLGTGGIWYDVGAA